MCGTLLFVASAAQQFGLTLNPSTAKAGFLTAMYVVLVPIFGLALGRRGSPQLWLSVAIAVCGLYLLCMQNGFGGVERSDMVLLLCAVPVSYTHLKGYSIMRRIQTGVIAVCLAAAFLSGCAGSSAQSTASSTAASSAAASSVSTTAVSANYDGGSGTQEDPYQINSVDSLLTFASNVNDGSQGGYAGVCFKLTSDLDLSGVEWAPIGNMNDMETHSTLFLGSFDGDGHTISNLSYTSDTYNCGAGLFGVSCGEVKNLTLEDATVTVTRCV